MLMIKTNVLPLISRKTHKTREKMLREDTIWLNWRQIERGKLGTA